MTDTPNLNLNFDQRQQDREKVAVQFGGVKYKRRRRTNAVMREFRALAREHAKLGNELRELDPFDDERERLVEEREVKLAEMVVCFLEPWPAKKGENPVEPTADLVKEHLDAEDLDELLDTLTPGMEVEDPTPAETSAPESS